MPSSTSPGVVVVPTSFGSSADTAGVRVPLHSEQGGSNRDRFQAGTLQFGRSAVVSMLRRPVEQACCDPRPPLRTVPTGVQEHLIKANRGHPVMRHLSPFSGARDRSCAGKRFGRRQRRRHGNSGVQRDQGDASAKSYVEQKGECD